VDGAKAGHCCGATGSVLKRCKALKACGATRATAVALHSLPLSCALFPLPRSIRRRPACGGATTCLRLVLGDLFVPLWRWKVGGERYGPEQTEQVLRLAYGRQMTRRTLPTIN